MNVRGTDSALLYERAKGNGCLEYLCGTTTRGDVCTTVDNKTRELNVFQVVMRIKPSDDFMLIKRRKTKRDEATLVGEVARRLTRRRAHRIYRPLAGNSVCGVIVASPYSRGARRGMLNSLVLSLSSSSSSSSALSPPARLIYDRTPRFSRGDETNELAIVEESQEGMQIGKTAGRWISRISGGLMDIRIPRPVELPARASLDRKSVV